MSAAARAASSRRSALRLRAPARRRTSSPPPDFVALKRHCLDLLRPHDGQPSLPRLTPLGLPLPGAA